MSESNDTLSLNQCYKCDPRLLDTLNIEHNSSNSVVVLWNKYQIFIYEDLNFTSPAKVFTPEYQVYRLLITNNYLLCLDFNGFVHVTTLKFKNPDQREYKCTYQPRNQGIITCVSYSPDESLSLKYDSETYFLCLNRIGTDFKEVKKVALNTSDPWPFLDSSRDKYLLVHRKINEHFYKSFEEMFSSEKLTIQCHFTVISFDKHTVYGCIFNPKMMGDKIDLVKLYSCPSEIGSIEIVGTESTYMLIGLKMGTILRFTLNDLCTCNTVNIKPEVTHLNSALHKLKLINDTLLYTDGATMWMADNIFSKNTAFKQFFVKNINDFIQYGDKIICTTFTKLIYSFAFQSEASFIKPLKKNYYEADELLENSEFIHKIFAVVEKSKDIAKQLSTEGSYIAAMALTNRQDIVHKVITSSVNICGSFEEVMKDNAEELTLTEDICRYVEPDIYLILVSVHMSSDILSVLFDIISDIMANSEAELQVTLSDKHKVLRTTCIKMSKTNFLIPVHIDDTTEIYVKISLVVRIPGTYDRKQKIWIELYKKNITLTSEQFVRVNSPKTVKYLKGMTENFEEAILTCSNQSRNEFEFTNTSNQPIDTYIMYVRLPPEFNFDKYFNDYKLRFMKEVLNTDEFLKSQNAVNLRVGKETVAISLENDGFSNPRLKVMSGNVEITARMRNFFADIVNGESTCEDGQEFINIGFYTTVEVCKWLMVKSDFCAQKNGESNSVFAFFVFYCIASK